MTPPGAPSTEAPTPGDVRAELDRVLASGDFRASERRRDLLRYLVEAGLSGRTDQLKGYTIGTEVFGRDPSFDPQTDPIVRLEVSRLRRDLEHHYLKSGTGDPVLISIPTGGNAPSFELRPDRAGSTAPEGAPVAPVPVGGGVPVRSRGRWPWVALALTLALGLAFLWQRFSESTEDPARDQRSVALAAARSGRVAAVVLPFDYTADSDPHPFLDGGLDQELVSALAAHPRLEVIALGTAEQVATKRLTPPEIAELLGVDYVVRGDIRQEGRRVRVTVSIIEARSSLVQVSNRYDGALDSVLDLQSEIARDLAESMATEVTPSLERRLRAAGDVDSEVLALYHQAATLRDPPSDPVRSRLAEEAYRRVIELDNDFAGGYAGLAYVLAFRSWWGLSDDPDADAAEAVEAARLAVQKAPEYGWAQTSLGIALSVAGDHDGAAGAARVAAVLAPSDPYVLCFSAMVQAFAGDIEAAVPLARRAIRIDPLSVRTPFRNVSGVTLFQAGRFEEALEVLDENLRLGGPDGPHMAFYRAGTLARLGREDEARRELERARAFPYEFDMRELLSAFRDPGEAAELLEALQSLGMEPQAPKI